ncbi:MAG: substrate-binding domain-containing protein [Planctomycetes bacterium]|nr:substrate-binding domain-containing protein [Planctomycetota bacterium]
MFAAERKNMGNTSTAKPVVAVAITVALTALFVTSLDGPHASPGDMPFDPAWMVDVPDNRPVRASVTMSFDHASRHVEARRGPYPAAAPMAEMQATRTARVPRELRTVALSLDARGMLDAGIEAGLENHTGCDITFAPCGDRDAVELLMVNRVDVALMGGSLSSRERHAGLRQTPLGVELFALAVAPEFPLQSLSSSQVRKVLTGEITNWQQLGCDRGAIVVVVPSRKDLLQRAGTAIIKGDNFTANAVRVADGQRVRDQLLRNDGAIAVVRLESPAQPGMKLLQIDRIPPTIEAFRSGHYPFGSELQLITSGNPDEFARQLLNYADSEDGQELLGRSLLVLH